MRTASTLATALGAAAVLLLPTAAAADSHTATLTAVHGIVDVFVDVYANDNLVIDDFSPGAVSDPLTIDPGTYTIDLTAADAADNSAPIVSATVTLAAGDNASAVAHGGEGGPALTVFANDVSPIDAGDARLTVRHVVGGSPVDVLVDGDVVFGGLPFLDEGVTELAAGDHDILVESSDFGSELFSLPGTTLAEGVNTIVYLTEGDALVQTIDGLHTSPGGVPAGGAGLADDGFVTPLAVVLGLAGLTLVVFALRRRDVEPDM